jgi:hypothetical protein
MGVTCQQQQQRLLLGQCRVDGCHLRALASSTLVLLMAGLLLHLLETAGKHQRSSSK